MKGLASKQWKTFRQWLDQPLGRAFLAAESEEVGELTAKLFGHYLILVGQSSFSSALKKSPIINRIWLSPELEVSINELSSVVARQDKLPFLSDEVELVYLAHCLEFLPNPHETLRESYRVLKPEGHVVISCFNPWSIWGIYRWLTHYINRVPWDGRFISLFRLKDWLALLGFDLIESRPVFFRPPIQNETWLKRLTWLETIGRWCWPIWSGCYIVLAKKRVMTLIPLRTKWKAKEKALASGLVEPAARN